MKKFKKILLALSVAASVSAFSSVSLAEPAKVPPLEAIAAIETQAAAATAMITAGGSSREEEINAIKKAKDLTKEVSANDKVDFKRQNLQQEYKKAIAEVKAGKKEQALEALKAATGLLNEMKALVN